MKCNARWYIALLCAEMLLTIIGNVGSAQAQSVPITAGYRDFYFGGTVNSMPTGEKPQSKLWWNDGVWWGSLWDFGLRKHTIHRFEVATQSWTSTGTAIDERTKAKADALWDGQRLYLVSQIFTHSPGPTTSSEAGRLYRYSYDPASKRYSLDAGFPVTVNGSISETLVLAKDSAGKLWVTWTEGGKVKVNRSLGDDLTWGAPFDLPVQGTDVRGDDISSVVAFGAHALAGDNKIGILWSNQNDKKSYFAIHLDGHADEAWEPKEEALADPALGAVSYDHINLKPSCDNDGNVYAVTKTNLTKSALPLAYLLKRTAAGVWTRYVLSTVSDGYDRPMLLIDGQHHKVYVFASSAATGSRVIYMKSSDLSNIAFAPGPGSPFIQSTTDSMISNPTSTKQCLNGATGLLVLASDQTTRFYFHNYLDLGGAPSQFTLTVNTAGSGSVMLNPPGGVYAAGTMVTLTANPASGFQFSGWSGDLSGSTNPATITMDADKNVTATFAPSAPGNGPIIQEETKTGGSSNAAIVTTSVNLTGVSGHLYLAAISTRPKVGVQAVSGLGLSWTLVKVKCSGRNSTGIQVWKAQGTPTGNGPVTATLVNAPQTAVIAVSRYSGVASVNPIGKTIAGNTNGVEGNGVCSGGVDNNAYSFNLNTAVNNAVVYGAIAMKARTHTPGAGYAERGEVRQAGDTYTSSVAVEDRMAASAGAVTVNGSFSGVVDWAMVALEIKPSLPQYALTVNTTGSGSVALSPPGSEAPAGATYNEGTVVTLTANPASGWQFSGWSGDLTGSNNPATMTMNANKNVTATFTASGGNGQVVHEETQTGGSTSSATVTTSTSLIAASGHLYLAAISFKSNVGVSSVSGLGLTWTRVLAQCAGRNQTGVDVWKAQGTASGNGPVTATLASTPSNAVIAVSRYSGVDAVNPIGNLISGNTNGANGACSGGLDNNAYSFDLSTTINGAMVYGAAAMRNTSHTPGAGYTERADLKQGSSNSSAAAVAVEDKSIASASTVSVNGTFSSAVDWAVVALEIKPQITMVKHVANLDNTTLAPPAEFQLEQNYPNPFNPGTAINFALPVAGTVTVRIYNETGQLVRTLIDGEMAAGKHSLLWNGRHQLGNPVAAGVYLYRIGVQGQNGEPLFIGTRRMTLLK
ncbi:MAG: InlB B-repeat-containing protein [bacterium]